MPIGSDSPLLYYVLVGLALPVVAVLVVLMQRRGRRVPKDGADLLNAIIERQSGGPRVRSAAPGGKRPAARTAKVDLSKPIGAAEWEVLRGLRRDERYRQSVAIVKAKYQFVGNPMLLANTLREVSESAGVDVAEALVLIAQDERIR